MPPRDMSRVLDSGHVRLSEERSAGLGARAVRTPRGVGDLAELTRDEVCGLLADVHRVVANPLEAARDGDHAQAPLETLGIGAEREHLADDAPVRAVDQLVQLDERFGGLDIALR